MGAEVIVQHCSFCAAKAESSALLLDEPTHTTYVCDGCLSVATAVVIAVLDVTNPPNPAS